MPDEQRTSFNRGAFREKYLMTRKSYFTPKTWNDFVADVANYLAEARITSFAGGNFDRSTNGTALSTSPGSGGAAVVLHQLSIVDASVMAVPAIQITPGNIGGYAPTIAGASINVKIGMPLGYPSLTVSAGDTMAWAHVLIAAADASIDYSTSTMDIGSGTALPPNTATDWYLKISDFTVAFDSVTGYATVASLDNNLFFSQAYGYCGLVPTTDMAAWGACYQNGAI